MLRFSADRRTLTFVAAYYALAITLWLLPFTWRITAPLVVVLAVLSWICAVITHNTLHSPVFRARGLNRIFQIVLSCSYGFPVSEYVPGHNLSHHKHTQSNKDVMRTTKVRFGWNLLNGLAFMPRVAVDVLGANYRYVSKMKAERISWYHQLLVESAFTWGIKLALLLVDWRKALVIIFVPHLFALWGITSVNYVQHDGCDAAHPYNHSRNFVGRIFNWFTFNNGFHGIHHDEPGLHWSLLSQAHYERVHPHIHPALEQRSLALYILRTFFIPGARVMYDGSKYVLPAPEADADWIPSQATLADIGADGAQPAAALR